MLLAKAKSSPSGQPLRDTGATLLTLGGVAAAFGLASCCGLPFLLATTLGVSSAWMGGIALLAAPHRLLLLWAGAFCLVAGALLLGCRRTAALCASDAICSKPTVRALTIVGLVVGLALLSIGYLYA
jgi:mercuric ion transport protein